MAQGGELYEEGWLAYIVYITSGRRTVQLGLLQGLYERFLIGNLIRYCCLSKRVTSFWSTTSYKKRYFVRIIDHLFIIVEGKQNFVRSK